jgi:hypothetical protein
MMYHLFGDPLLRLRLPPQSVATAEPPVSTEKLAR